jgi:hypothetical protein
MTIHSQFNGFEKKIPIARLIFVAFENKTRVRTTETEAV